MVRGLKTLQDKIYKKIFLNKVEIIFQMSRKYCQTQDFGYFALFTQNDVIEYFYFFTALRCRLTFILPTYQILLLISCLLDCNKIF